MIYVLSFEEDRYGKATTVAASESLVEAIKVYNGPMHRGGWDYGLLELFDKGVRVGQADLLPLRDLTFERAMERIKML